MGLVALVDPPQLPARVLMQTGTSRAIEGSWRGQFDALCLQETNGGLQMKFQDVFGDRPGIGFKKTKLFMSAYACYVFLSMLLSDCMCMTA